MNGSAPSPGGTRATRRWIPLTVLLLGSGISWLGNTLASIAIPWYVLTTTGSPVLTGVTASVTGVAVVVAALAGGIVIDRLGARPTIIIADLTSGVMVALIPILAAAHLLPFWVLLALVFAGAILDPPGNAARQALLPAISEPAAITPERANAAYTATLQAMELVGAPLAGLLIATVGIGRVLWLDVVTFAASTLLLLIGVPTIVARHQHERADQEEGETPGSGIVPEIGNGLRFLLRDPLLRSFVLIGTIQSLLGPALLRVVLPVYVLRAFGGAESLGLLLASFTIGSLASAALYGVLANRLPRRPVILYAAFLATLGVGMLALAAPLPVLLVAMVLIGLEQGPGAAIFNALLQRRTPPELLGRVISTVIAFALVGGPLGTLLGGFALASLGVRDTVLLLVAGYAAVWLTWLRSREARAMDELATVAA